MNEWVALITDQHFGVRNNSQTFLDYYFKFYDDVFFPALEEYDVLDIIDLGDTFDKRKSIDFNILDQVKERYYQKLLNMEKTVYSIVGNHTAYYKNTNRVNTLKLLLNDFENVYICEEPEVVRINENDVLLMPWINEENRDIAFELLEKNHEYCFGHLEINGFEMYKGHVHSDGEFDSNIFKNVKNVFSGHFHHRSKKGNIMYLGNPYQLTWGDYGDVRGFHMLNFETGELKFIENPYQMFHTIKYDNKFDKIDFEKYRDTYVKVICNKKGSQLKFETFMKRLHQHNPADVIIIEQENIFNNEDLDDSFEEENTKEICQNTVRKYIEENSISFGNRLEDKLLNLLRKAEEEEV
jgi:hypothetical protein